MESKSDECLITSKPNDTDAPENTLRNSLTSHDLKFDSVYDNDLRYDYDSIDEYFFESARLAYKTDSSYKNLVQTIVLLEAGQEEAEKNLKVLSMHRKRAATSPLHYIEKIKSKENFGITKARKVDFLADINKNIVSSVCNISEEYMNGDSSAENKSHLGNYSSLKTHNPWTKAEQSQLEDLLLVYPPEEIESRRWEKIANALGTRTPKQVASRAQKHFIKLMRDGIPIPGRQPNPKYMARNSLNTENYQHGKASVPGNNGGDENSRPSMATSDSLSDEDMEGINPKLKNTFEYQELMLIKKVLQQKSKASKYSQGYMN